MAPKWSRHLNSQIDRGTRSEAETKHCFTTKIFFRIIVQSFLCAWRLAIAVIKISVSQNPTTTTATAVTTTTTAKRNKLFFDKRYTEHCFRESCLKNNNSKFAPQSLKLEQNHNSKPKRHSDNNSAAEKSKPN